MAYSDTSGLVSALTLAFTPSATEDDPRGKIATALAAYIVGNFESPGTEASKSAVESTMDGDLSGMSDADGFSGKLSTAVTNAAAAVAAAPNTLNASELIAPPVPPTYTFTSGDSAAKAAEHIASVTAAYVTTGKWVGVIPPTGSPVPPLPGLPWGAPPPPTEDEGEEEGEEAEDEGEEPAP